MNKANLVSENTRVYKFWDHDKNVNLNPKKLSIHSRKLAWWKCPISDDHVWEQKIDSRAMAKTNDCPFCLKQRVSFSNSLYSTHPEIAKEWHPTRNGNLKPTQYTSGSHKTFWWKCSEGEDHEWEQSINKRKLGKKKCPFFCKE